MIRCENLEKRYGNSTALRNFSFTFAPGHIYALLGPNGSGKSTLMKSLAGLVKPSAGRIMVEDHELSYKDKQTIAYMPTEPYFYNYMTAMQVAKYYQDFFTDFSMDKFTWTMSRLGLDPAKKVAAYSTGMMAKFKVALNVARNPKMMMLDEPLNGIDMIAREEVTAGIVNGINRDAAILVSSHLIEDLERIADYVLFIKEGHLVVSGPTATFREQYGKSMTDMYREIYGAAILYSAPYGAVPGQPYAVQAGQPYAQPVSGQPYVVPGVHPNAVPTAGQPYVALGVQPNAVPTAGQPYVAPGVQPNAVPTAGQPYVAPSAQANAVPPAGQSFIIQPPAPGMTSAPIDPVQNPYRAGGASETPEDFDNPLA